MNYLPQDTEEKLKSINYNIDNFALELNKYHPIYDKKTGFKRFREGQIRNHLKTSFKDETFRLINDRQLKNARLLFGDKKYHTLENAPDYRLIIGLGEASVYETSMSLHHIYGVPFISGQSIKGAVRSYVINTLFDGKEERKTNNNDNKVEFALENEEFRSIFGGPKNDKFDKDQQGKIIFLDAFPIKSPTIKTDIMNPHFNKYYADGSVPPGDYMDPVPVTFLTIGKNKNGESVFFNFILGIKEDNPELLEKAAEYLEKTLKSSGIGAKTAIGYGYFDEHGKVLDEVDKLQLEQEKVREEEKRRKEKLATMSPADQAVAKLSMLSNDADGIRISVEIYTNDLDKLEGNDKIKVARAIKDYWIKIGKWKVKPKKKQFAKVEKIKNILGEK
jgi:CRISPR-associated protein Cmr6